MWSRYVFQTLQSAGEHKFYKVTKASDASTHNRRSLIHVSQTAILDGEFSKTRSNKLIPGYGGYKSTGHVLEPSETLNRA